MAVRLCHLMEPTLHWQVAPGIPAATQDHVATCCGLPKQQEQINVGVLAAEATFDAPVVALGRLGSYTRALRGKYDCHTQQQLHCRSFAVPAQGRHSRAKHDWSSDTSQAQSATVKISRNTIRQN